MNTILELVTALGNANSIEEAVATTMDCTAAGAKDIYLAWGKEKGYKVADLNSAWKEAQPKKAAGATGFAAEYYAWLAEESRSEQEAHDLIMSGSTNVQNHLTHYLNIWALCETVRRGQAVERTIGAVKKAKSAKKVAQEPEPVKAKSPANPLKEALKAIAQGEFKTITKVRNALKLVDKDMLSITDEGVLADLRTELGESGITLEQAQKVAVKVLNEAF